MSATDEAKLAKAIQRHRKAKREAFLDIPFAPERLPHCDPQAGGSPHKLEEHTAAFWAHDAALTRAKQALVEHHLWLVTSIAYRWRQRGAPTADLIQEGNLGLLRATETYDPDRGVRFSTYAGWWIRQAIARAVYLKSRCVYIPMHVWDAISRYERASARLQTRLGRRPDEAEVRGALGMDESAATRLQLARQPELSLQARGPEEDSRSLEEQLSDPSSPNAFETVQQKQLCGTVATLLDALDTREETVVRRRFGWGDREEETLEEIAADLCVSRERTRQIEAKALGKLRKRALARGLGQDVARSPCS